MDEKKPYTAPLLERTHHIWQLENLDVRPDCICNECANARRLQAERDEARAERMRRALDSELDKARRFAEARDASLVERELVCPACRRHFGRILAPVSAEVRPVCDGCVLEGRM